MECVTAQGIISDALNRAPIDAATLSEAKAHCQTCPTCSVFVRTMLLVKNAPLPEPPADLADRVMDAVRSEALLAEQRAAAAALQLQATESADDVESAAMVVSDTPAAISSAYGDVPRSFAQIVAEVGRRAASLPRREMILWASAAVVFVAAVGLTANAGIRVLTTSPTATTDKAQTAEMGGYGTPLPPSAAAPTESADAAAGMSALASPSGSFITVGGMVYVLSGPSDIATASLKPAGSTTSALGSALGPMPHVVYAGDDPERVYLAGEATSQLLAFNRVVRQHEGRTYQLNSTDLSDFGQWPSLPAQIPAPTAPDGSPTFAAVAPSTGGTQVYRLSSGGGAAGIGIGPGSAPSDPAAGNPNWTWWTQIP